MQPTLYTEAPPEITSLAPPSRFQRRSFRRTSIILLFLLPSFAIYLLFVIYPVIQAGFYSFYSWDGLEPLTNFIGLKNYTLAFADKVFQGAFIHNLVLLVLALLLQLPFALFLALLIGKKLPGRTIFRTIFFMPYILSEVIAGVIWEFIYRPDGGINIVLQHASPTFQPILWLGDTKLVLFSIFIAMTWKYFGLHLVLYSAALQNIPDEIIEAARLDGASAFQITRYINIPLLGSMIRLSIFLSALGSLQYFDLIWIISNGGPVHASETMATYLFKYGFRSYELGYGSAVGVLIFLSCFVFSMIYQRFVMRRDLAGSLTARAA